VLKNSNFIKKTLPFIFGQGLPLAAAVRTILKNVCALWGKRGRHRPIPYGASTTVPAGKAEADDVDGIKTRVVFVFMLIFLFFIVVIVTLKHRTLYRSNGDLSIPPSPLRFCGGSPHGESVTGYDGFFVRRLRRFLTAKHAKHTKNVNGYFGLNFFRVFCVFRG